MEYMQPHSKDQKVGVMLCRPSNIVFTLCGTTGMCWVGKGESSWLKANFWLDPYAWVLVCPSCIYRFNENCTAKPTEWDCTPQYKKKKLCECRPFEVWLL